MRWRRVATAAVLLALAVVAAACGDDGDDASTTSATTAAPAGLEQTTGVASTTAATSEPPASASAGATTIDASTATTVPLADVQDAELELGSPDYLVELDGTVWVKLDGGDVVAVDPATAKELRSLDVDPGQEQLCQGLGAGGGYLWTCTGSDVVRIDPETATIVDTIPAAKIPDQANLPFQEGRMWVLGGNGDRLVGIDAASAKPGDPVALPVSCSDVGPGAGSTVWVVCPLANQILQVDVDAGEVLQRIDLEAPTIAWGTDDTLWVGAADGVLRIDLATMQPVAVFDGLHVDLGGDLVVDGDDVWVRSPARVPAPHRRRDQHRRRARRAPGGRQRRQRAPDRGRGVAHGVRRQRAAAPEARRLRPSRRSPNATTIAGRMTGVSHGARAAARRRCPGGRRCAARPPRRPRGRRRTSRRRRSRPR